MQAFRRYCIAALSIIIVGGFQQRSDAKRADKCPCKVTALCQNESCIFRYDSAKINSWIATPQPVVDAAVASALAECKKGKSCWLEDGAWNKLDNFNKIVEGKEDGQTFAGISISAKGKCVNESTAKDEGGGDVTITLCHATIILLPQDYSKQLADAIPFLEKNKEGLEVRYHELEAAADKETKAKNPDKAKLLTDEAAKLKTQVNDIDELIKTDKEHAKNIKKSLDELEAHERIHQKISEAYCDLLRGYIEKKVQEELCKTKYKKDEIAKMEKDANDLAEKARKEFDAKKDKAKNPIGTEKYWQDKFDGTTDGGIKASDGSEIIKDMKKVLS
jgi:hypothetical protein